MFVILNRLRGTESWMSKVISIILFVIVYLSFGNVYVASAVGLGYLLGESFGWGEWVGTLCVKRENMNLEGFVSTEGQSWGIKQLAQFITKIDFSNLTVSEWIKYCNVALAIRGLYWWIPTLAPLYFVGVSGFVLVSVIVLLSIGFPIACYIGYLTAPKFNIHFKFFEKYDLPLEMAGGWEHQEVWYGLMQDISFICIIISIIA